MLTTNTLARGSLMNIRLNNVNKGSMKRSRRASEVRSPDINALDAKQISISSLDTTESLRPRKASSFRQDHLSDIDMSDFKERHNSMHSVPQTSSSPRRRKASSLSETTTSLQANNSRQRKKSSIVVPTQYLSLTQEERQRGDTITSSAATVTPDWLYTLKPGEIDCPCLLHCNRMSRTNTLQNRKEQRKSSPLRVDVVDTDNKISENIKLSLKSVGTQTEPEENRKLLFGCFPKVFK